MNFKKLGKNICLCLVCCVCLHCCLPSLGEVAAVGSVAAFCLDLCDGSGVLFDPVNKTAFKLRFVVAMGLCEVDCLGACDLVHDSGVSLVCLALHDSGLMIVLCGMRVGFGLHRGCRSVRCGNNGGSPGDGLRRFDGLPPQWRQSRGGCLVWSWFCGFFDDFHVLIHRHAVKAYQFRLCDCSVVVVLFVLGFYVVEFFDGCGGACFV